MLSKALLFLIIYSMTAFGCAFQSPTSEVSTDECIEQLRMQLEKKPRQMHLKTLDGQEVLLDEFFMTCLIHAPLCSLPEKFYYWKSSIKTVVSKAGTGTVMHKIRIYYNYLSTCSPDAVDSQKTHGDIAEFYNPKGEFMGLAVYAGSGLYCPLPYSKYGPGSSTNGLIMPQDN
jgi:hypothetical protein